MSAIATLNPRERYLATMQFARPDRIPMTTMGPRESTLKRWREEGLPEKAHWFEFMCQELGIKYEQPQRPAPGLDVSFIMIPTFEEKVLEHNNGHYIVQDWMGNITEISDQFDVTYIRNAKDFVTRKWHKFPVETREDFEKMKKRYNVDEPGRFPADFRDRCLRSRERDSLMRLHFSGPFWQMREWCGFEPLCMLFLDDPEFVREMCDFWSDFISSMLERICAEVAVDCVHVSEDMAYKGASMISPAMTREFLLPVWSRWNRIIKTAGVPLYDIDSDGSLDDLIPVFIEGGFNICDPIEVAAGCDIVTYRNKYGKKIAYTGGIDKRCIAKGGVALEKEMSRIAPVVRSGGYIPGCDHGIPFDVSWKNMLHFGRLWAEVTGWL